MNTVSVEVPASLHGAVSELARASGVSVNQIVASAIAEKVSALAGNDWFAARAAHGNRSAYDEALAKIADVEPEEDDRR
ncbi:MAG: hypothetical protein K2X38_20870 [Gemmataceae bacterium]|nr:hypothetical protein [Gemmataceae bacterium]